MRHRLQLRQFLRIAYIVEMYAVDIVTSCHLGADVGEVVSSLLCLRIHVSVALNLYYVVRHLVAQLLAA